LPSGQEAAVVLAQEVQPHRTSLLILSAQRPMGCSGAGTKSSAAQKIHLKVTRHSPHIFNIKIYQTIT